MEIVNHRQKVLDATESNAKGNDDFATKVISLENVEKKVEEVRRKNQTYFRKNITILKFWTRMYIEWFI